ncbi:MAG: hypothetical protein HUU03_09065 [Planctomycetaceae bacterium]|nr:hypothetical protein [Planctomycetaceae bacterium]
MTRVVLLLSLLGLAAPLCAQSGYMSEEYLRERERQKFAKPHGISAEVDVFGLFPFFDQWQSVKADGVKADRVNFARDLNGVPFGAFLDTNVRVRFSWYDSLELGYSFSLLREFDKFEDSTRWNGFIYPEGIDADYGSDFHDFHALYRRDLFYLGSSSNFSLFLQAGLEWAIIDTQVGSDDFTPQDNRERERFRELLPWAVGGAGFVWDISRHFRLSASAFAGYQDGFPTFQKREGRRVKQSVFSLTGRLLFEWRPVSFFSVLVGAKYRYLNVELESKVRHSEFSWMAMGPEIGIGFRF